MKISYRPSSLSPPLHVSIIESPSSKSVTLPHSSPIRHRLLLRRGSISPAALPNPGALTRSRLCGNGETVDAQISADAIDDQERPTEIDDHGEDQVRAQVPEFDAGGDGRETDAGQVAQDGAADERDQHDGPVGERLPGEMGEDDFGCHAAEDEGHGQAEEDQSVLAHQGRVGGVEPRADGRGVDGDGRPFQEDGGHGKAVRAAGLDDVVDASGQVGDEEGAEDERDPEIDHGALP